MSNINKNKKYYFTYKTTNLLNNKYYYGMHSTNNLDDGYMGSGKHLGYSIKKYGKENFKVKILEFFDSQGLLTKAEITLITEHDLDNPNCMNIKPGGQGGFINEEHALKFHKAGGKRVLQILSEQHTLKLKNNVEYKNKWLKSVRDSAINNDEIIIDKINRRLLNHLGENDIIL